MNYLPQPKLDGQKTWFVLETETEMKTVSTCVSVSDTDKILVFYHKLEIFRTSMLHNISKRQTKYFENK